MDLLQEIEYVAKQLEDETLESVMATFTPYGTEEDYDNLLNEVHGDIKICGYEYQAAYVLELVDPIAYRCGYGDYFSNFLDDEEHVEYKDYAYRIDDLTEWLEQYEHLRPHAAV